MKYIICGTPCKKLKTFHKTSDFPTIRYFQCMAYQINRLFQPIVESLFYSTHCLGSYSVVEITQDQEVGGLDATKYINYLWS